MAGSSSPYHTSLYTLSGEKFQNGTWPTPSPQENSTFIRILCSASIDGGILCVSQENLHDHVTIVLWNPATGEYKLVPHSHQPYENIEFNPLPLAFGYDHVTDDYMVIRIAQYPIYFKGNWICLPETDNLFWKMDSVFPDDDDIFWEGRALRVYEPFWEIYSLKNKSWRKLDGIDVPVPRYALCEVNLNELCHWLGANNKMVSFDFRNEIFLATTLPSFNLKSSLLAKNLVVLNGSVAFICTLGKTAYFQIWILGEVGVEESWTNLFVVGPVPCIRCPLVVGIKSVIFYLDGIAWFDLSTQRIDEIGVKAESSCSQIVIYKENLFYVHRIIMFAFCFNNCINDSLYIDVAQICSM